MTSLAVTNALSTVLVPLGGIAAILAVLCALVAGIALARGAAGLSAGAVGGWIVFTLLSLAASFASLWLPTVAAVAALAIALALGGLLRAIFRPRPTSRVTAERPGARA